MSCPTTISFYFKVIIHQVFKETQLLLMYSLKQIHIIHSSIQFSNIKLYNYNLNINNTLSWSTNCPD
jgi:hypothetical protein